MARFWIQRRSLGTGEYVVDFETLDEHARFRAAAETALARSRRDRGALFDVHDCVRDEGPFGSASVVATALDGRLTTAFGDELAEGPDGEAIPWLAAALRPARPVPFWIPV